MMHIYTSDEMKDEFLALYKKDFEITGGDNLKMETFLGMAVEQKGKSIKIHLDNFIKDVLTEYSAYQEIVKTYEGTDISGRSLQG